MILKSSLTWVHTLFAEQSAGSRQLPALALPFLMILCLPNTTFSQCTVVCKSGLNVSLPVSGSVSISPDILLEDDDCDPLDFYVEITDGAGNNLGNTVDCAKAGQSVLAGVIHNTNGNSCYTTLNVLDYIKPQFNCLDTTILCINPYSPQDIGNALVTDNCGISSLTYTDEYIEVACLTVHNGDTIMSRVERTWTAEDESGNSSTCIQNIYLKMATINDVEFPAHRNGFAAPALDCMDDPTDLSITGVPTVNGLAVSNEGICQLVVSHQDQTIADCSPNAFRVLRTWTVINSCTGNFTLNVQIIKVSDTTAPEIQCPENQTVGTHGYDCLATVNLPLASATDDCSSINITPSWTFGSGYGPFNGVPIGNHLVTYTAEDACGNTSTCDIELTVIDNVIPIMVCDPSTVVYLSSAGIVEIDATAFDDGSSDNCTLDQLDASRDGLNYSSGVVFDCLDADQTITIALRATDLDGNSNECSVEVTVREVVKPTLSCPSNLTLICTEDYTNLNLTGNAFTADACGIDSLFYSDEINSNSCGIGQINRTWTANDVNGNTKSCLQQISLIDNTPIEVFFPSNYTTSICNMALDTALTGQATVIYDCEQISVDYQDQVFDIAAPACYQVIRTWTVIDWCVYDPNSGSTDGYYAQNQVISVLDEDAPVMNCPADTVIGAINLTCEGTYASILPATAMDCNPNLTFSNDSPYADANGADASGNYPIGVHIIQFTAADGCGNSSTCSMTIEITDATPPSAVCLQGVSVGIAAEGWAILTPEMLDNGSADNCSGPAQLTFAVSKDTFYCADKGAQSVILTVTDASENQSSCTTIVDIQDNSAICAPTVGRLSGQIIQGKGLGVEAVRIDLLGDMTASTLTDENGQYTFDDVPLGGDYTIVPSKNANFINGINTYDLILMSRHILGISYFNSPYKVIASDVNESVNTTSFDMIEIRKLLLNIDTAFAQVESWTFVDSDYTFINPGAPLAEDYPQSRIITNLLSDQLDLDFIGIKTGDVNHSHNPSNFTSGDTRNEGPIRSLETDERDLTAGEAYEIPFRVQDLGEIMGFQFSLELDLDKISSVDLRISEAGVALGLSQDNFGETLLDKGFLTASWINAQNQALEAGTVLFYLQFNCRKSTALKEAIQLNSHYTKAESYINRGMDEPELGQMKLNFTNLTPKNVHFQVNQNRPNPVREKTSIGLNLPDASCGTLTIYNVEGRALYTRDYCGNAGYQDIILDRSQINLSGGFYYVELNWGDLGRQTIKMMLID